MKIVIVICIVLFILLWIAVVSSIILAHNLIKSYQKNEDLRLEVYEIYKNNFYHKEALVVDICSQLKEIVFKP